MESFKFIVSMLWILFSPLTFGALFPVVIALFVTKNQFIVGMSYIIYASVWFWINETIVIKKNWF